MSGAGNDVTVLVVAPDWKIGELAPAMQQFDASLQYDYLNNECLFVAPGTVDPAEILQVIIDALDDDEATYG